MTVPATCIMHVRLHMYSSLLASLRTPQADQTGLWFGQLRKSFFFGGLFMVVISAGGAQPGNPVCAEIDKASWNGQWGDGTDEYHRPVKHSRRSPICISPKTADDDDGGDDSDEYFENFSFVSFARFFARNR